MRCSRTARQWGICAIHQREEAGVVGRLDQVNHFVDHEILETGARLLRELGVEADAARPGITAAPSGLLPLDEEAFNAHTE